MSLRPFPLSALLAGALLASPAAADRLLVTGPSGTVYQADTETGEFQYFACQCGGPVQAMAADKNQLFTADAFGQVLVYDRDTGMLETVLSPAMSPATALATADGFLFAGNADAIVARIDPATGQILDTRSTPAGVRALLAHRGFLFAGGEDGAVYRAPIDGGAFTYFTCFCFFNIEDVRVENEKLVIADQFGTVGIADLGTGQLLNAFWLGSSTTAVAIQDGDLLAHTTGGTIERFRIEDGTPMPNGYSSPIEVGSMIVLPNDPPPPLTQLRKDPATK